jgi:uncharacterized iron-regulated protein
MKRINQMTSDSQPLQDLLMWRKTLRSNRADSLRQYRKYKKMWGERDYMTTWMKGFAEGSKSPLQALDYIIRLEVLRDE